MFGHLHTSRESLISSVSVYIAMNADFQVVQSGLGPGYVSVH